ncbi:hypothetical protein NDU88_002836 [Pleurodeles waltl]|uniref:exodeoxyribonuclease III n=3 Tax=Pleurodeles waltl TaxID=8319 RepID=A0AAV7SEF0_PLEWA|nr:hypothetical protein NDU88_002836 [Pleurodeles waltl]
MLSDRILQHKLNNLFRNLSEKSEAIACGFTITYSQHISDGRDLSTLFSDMKKGVGFDKFAGASRTSQFYVNNNSLAGVSDSGDPDKEVTSVSIEEEYLLTANALTQLSDSDEEAVRCGGVYKAKEDHFNGSYSLSLSGESDYENRCSDVIIEKKQTIERNDLNQLSESMEHKMRCTGIIQEQEGEELMTRNALVGLSKTVECRHKSMSNVEQELHFTKNDLLSVLETEKEPVNRKVLTLPSRSVSPPDQLLKIDDDFAAPGPMNLRLQKKRSSTCSELDHIHAYVGKSLQQLAKTYKELTCEVLLWFQSNCSTQCILHYCKDPAGLERALLGIVDHAYGDHEGCGHWCEFNRHLEAYRPATFQPMLSNPSLKPKLNALFNKLADNREKVARFSSKKVMKSPTAVRCESHKTSDLESPLPLRSRLKNAGYTDLFPESMNTCVSVTKNTRFHSISKHEASKLENYELKRVRNPKKECVKEKSKLSPCLSNKDDEGSSADLETPPLLSKPPMEFFSVKQPMVLVFFDLETTSLTKDCEIVQLAAICGEKTFDRYILPVRGMSAGASRVTGLTVSGGVLRLLHRPLHVVPLREALVQFLEWLKGFGQCLLVGHNSKTFDAPRLLLQLDKKGLAETFCHTVLGFLDTLPYFRETRPHLPNHRQQTLASELLKVKYNAHRALDDVKILQSLVQRFADHAALAKHGFSATWVYQTMKYELQKQKNLTTFAILEKKKVISKGMCEKMAGSGLQEYDLRVAHAQAASRGEQGRDGIMKLLTEKDDGGKIRVTNQAKVLDRLAQFYDIELNLGR